MGTAFSELWPILLTMGGGYATLLGLIYKILTDRIAALEVENKELRQTVAGFQKPLDKVADSSAEMNRTLEQMLDGILPRGPKGQR